MNAVIEQVSDMMVDYANPEDVPVQPVGWRILIEPMKVKTRTAGGIELPDQAKKAEEYLRFIGRVVRMGPLCYQHPKFLGVEPACKVGDWVAYSYHAGQSIMVTLPTGKVEFKLVNDDEIRAVITDPQSIMTYV